jgi:hypothetical protein
MSELDLATVTAADGRHLLAAAETGWLRPVPHCAGWMPPTSSATLTRPWAGISRSTSRCIIRRPSAVVLSQTAGLVGSRLCPSISVMNRSPVPVSTSTRLSRSSPISYRARGKSVCIGPVNVAGPPSVWNLSVSTPDGVRVNAKFLNALK